MNQISSDFLQRPKVADPLAILVDGENMSLAFAKTLLKEAEAFGVPTVRRVYGKAEHIAGWENEGFRLVPTRPGKNSADLLLCVEAMSLALRESFQTLLIASSDRDFSYLAEHLRELGHQVVGIGETKAPLAFRKTCSAFVEVATVPQPSWSEAELLPTTPQVLIPATKIIPLVRPILAHSTRKDGGGTICFVERNLKAREGGFDSTHYGAATLAELLRRVGYFKLEDVQGTGLVVFDPSPKSLPKPAPHTAP